MVIWTYYRFSMTNLLKKSHLHLSTSFICESPSAWYPQNRQVSMEMYIEILNNISDLRSKFNFLRELSSKWNIQNDKNVRRKWGLILSLSGRGLIFKDILK